MEQIELSESNSRAYYIGLQIFCMFPKGRILKRLSEGTPSEIRNILSRLDDEEKTFFYNKLLLEIEPTESLQIEMGVIGGMPVYITINKSRLLIIYKWFEENKKLQTNDKAGNCIILPGILNTDRAQKYFAKAIHEGFLELAGTICVSKFGTKALLTYFLELVFCRDDDGKDNSKAFPEKDLCSLFNESRLGKARGQYLNNSDGKPRGHEIVDKIFA